MRIVDESLLDRFRVPQPCEWCRIKVGTVPHHIFSRGAGRLDVAGNIVCVDALCHALIHDGHIKRADLLKIVARRERTTVEAIVAEIHRLRALPKGSEP